MARPKKTPKAEPVTEISGGGVTKTGLTRHPIRMMPLSMLKPAAYNPRRISDYAKTGLRNAIEKFGMVQSIVWNERTGNVVGGHQRLDALTAMGEDTAEVVVVDLSEQDEKMLNLSLNNPETQGTWDDEKLQELIDTMSADSAFDSVLVDDIRLSELVKQLASKEIDDMTDFDRAPAEPPGEFKSVDGDTIATDYRCPKCAYEWSGRAK